MCNGDLASDREPQLRSRAASVRLAPVDLIRQIALWSPSVTQPLLCVVNLPGVLVVLETGAGLVRGCKLINPSCSECTLSTLHMHVQNPVNVPDAN